MRHLKPTVVAIWDGVRLLTCKSSILPPFSADECPLHKEQDEREPKS